MKLPISVPAIMALALIQAAALSGAARAAEGSQLLRIPDDVPPFESTSVVPGHPLTSVVITQCNLLVAVYMTTADGKLVRFDKSASIPVDKLMTMASAATHSERVEVSCNDRGPVGFERHDPV